MERLIAMARTLGEKIEAHERTVLLKEAQKKAMEDPQAKALMQEYQEQIQKVQQLQAQQKPVEVADKRALQEIEQKISMNEVLTDLTKRQMDFVEMLRKVKQAIDDQLQIEE